MATTSSPKLIASKPVNGLSHLLPDPQTTRILIGEVNLINSTVIKKMLEKLGYQTIEQVENGVQAVEAAEKEHFHFIFLDLRLPMIGGVEATKIIRKTEKEKQKPELATIVGLSAVYTDKALFHDKQICYACGMNSVIRMPLHMKDLRDVLSAYGQQKTVPPLRTLVMMYITNQPQLFQYTTKQPNTIFRIDQDVQEEIVLPSEVMEELHSMKESYPPLYKYPNFEGLDDAEILEQIPGAYNILKRGVENAIKAEDVPAVHRCATALVSMLGHLTESAQGAAEDLSSCKDIEQAKKCFRTLRMYMGNVWD